MRTNSFQDISRNQAKHRAAFQRQILSDIRLYVREKGSLPQSARHGLRRLESTLSQNIVALEYRFLSGGDSLAS